ncbi:WAT1-related protein At3g18200-like [Magnolia sinica]|uniref:WAT1-related protein At3g18200-like n=1 Tax=Magnolia sinica TaxID=86752 RepID=UPI0026592156|nr:WAT1-related protein At3g18200-like [Magnolia sinica]
MNLELAFQKINSYKPHLLLTLCEFSLSIFMILLESLISRGISSLVIVVYEHVVATVLLSALAFFFEKKRRPPLTFEILSHAFFLGLLQITLCQMLLTLSLRYISATFQSVGLNTLTALIFVVAVVFRQEEFRFWSVHGQAKMWGVVVSTAGATQMVLWKGPVLLGRSAFGGFQATGDETLGSILLVVALLSAASWNLLVRQVTRKYPAPLSLTAMMNFFGTIQSAVVTAFIVPRASWELRWEGGLVLFGILYGGIVVTGLLYYVQIWCIDKKGPVFAAAFSPLLIIFSFLLDTVVLRDSAHLGSIIGAVLVVN